MVKNKTEIEMINNMKYVLRNGIDKVSAQSILAFESSSF